MSTGTRKIEPKYKINIIDISEDKTIKEIIKERNITYNGAIILKVKDDYIHKLDYYYNENDEVEFYKNIEDIPINKLKEYDIDIQKELEISIVDGMGSSSGGIDFETIYKSIENFVSTHPAIYDSIKVIGVFVITKIKTIFNHLSKKCSFDVFKKALYHKKILTENDVIKSFGLKECDKDNKNDIAAIEIILEYMGYTYDEEQGVWVLKNPK